MPKLPIDLAMGYGSENSPPLMVKMPEPEPYYPGTRLEFKGDYELPDEGEITFRYRVTRSTEEKKTDKCCEEIDFLEIVAVKELKDSSKDEDYAGDTIDKLRAELEAKESE